MLGLVADKRETLQQQLRKTFQMVLLELEAAEQRCRQAWGPAGPPELGAFARADGK